MKSSRRDFLRGGAFTAAGLWSTSTPHAATASAAADVPASGLAYLPIEVPDVPKLPYTRDGVVKVFHLRCEVVKQRFVPWREPFNTWGYNGSTPGPTIEVVEGDRVRIVVENHLPEETGVHWHGIELPIEMDGVPGLLQDPIATGASRVYEFTLQQNGTFFYHSHMPMQEMMGMIGFFIVHPRTPHQPRVDRDFGIVLQEWAILPNNSTPNTLAMEFNWLTLNGKAGPATTPLLVKQGERVRIRFVNLGMDHHPMHLHGNTWVVTGTEGGRTPRSTWRPGNTELVGVAQARDVELEAKALGDWMLHCHLPHHMMNHMASMVGPLSEPSGVTAGLSMERGMGVLHGGHALAAENEASLGRTLGSGNAERAVANAPMDPHHGPMQFHPVPADARQVPGYPQDMFMVTDEWFKDKPETHGMRPTWTAGMMGMMTTLRVLTPERFAEIEQLLDERRRRDAEEMAPAVHDHGAGGGR